MGEGGEKRERERASASPYHMHRQRRMAEMLAAQSKAKYGSVKEISAVDYVEEVNKAGDGVWVVLHLYQSGYPYCTLLVGGACCGCVK